MSAWICPTCGRPQASAALWAHAPGCECDLCVGACWSRSCQDRPAPVDGERVAEVRDALGEFLDALEWFDAGLSNLSLDEGSWVDELRRVEE